jgi:hypothetical protein
MSSAYNGREQTYVSSILARLRRRLTQEQIQSMLSNHGFLNGRLSVFFMLECWAVVLCGSSEKKCIGVLVLYIWAKRQVISGDACEESDVSLRFDIGPLQNSLTYQKLKLYQRLHLFSSLLISAE